MTALSVQNGHILYVDAYDSFAENITALLTQLLSVQVTSVKVDHDFSSISTFVESVDAIIIGPGPGDPHIPDDIGIIGEIWEIASRYDIPVLGICLGFQSLCMRFGAEVVKLPLPCHGHAQEIHHNNRDIFHGTGLVIATNYHSLQGKLVQNVCEEGISRPSSGGSFASRPGAVSSTSSDSLYTRGSIDSTSELVALAWNDAGVLMAARHFQKPFWGVQFHPESCKSNLACHTLLQNWWIMARSGKDAKLVGKPQPQMIIGEDRGDQHVMKDRTMQKILKAMAQLSKTSVSTVAWRAVRVSVGLNELAQYCLSRSTAGTIAMLESTKKDRFSIFPMPSPTTWRFEYCLIKETCTLLRNEQVIAQYTCSPIDALQILEQHMQKTRAAHGPLDVPFWGGFIGHLTYELGLHLLGADVNSGEIHTTQPDVNLVWTERSMVFDNATNHVYVQSIRENDENWIGSTIKDLQNMIPARYIPSTNTDLEACLASAYFHLPSQEDYIDEISICQDYLRSGDSYELCLTTEAQITLPLPLTSVSCLDKTSPSMPATNALNLYLALRTANPVPFSAYLSLGPSTILSSSPESFISWPRSSSISASTISMLPMKGTVAKSPTMTLAKARAILATPKESAENLMIADLIRHDLYSALGRAARVEVVKLCEVVEHETVYQMVSHIKGHMPTPADASKDERARLTTHYGHKALRTALPAGSMTGAPKKRSCEILSRLERRRRAVYSGVIGYFDVGGGGGWSVAIRTAWKDRREDAVDEEGVMRETWRVGAGGAITVLSDAESEWEEMRTKMGSVLKAFGVREEHWKK